MAESVGVEPTKDFSLPVFKTGALSHSASSPYRKANITKVLPDTLFDYFTVQEKIIQHFRPFVNHQNFDFLRLKRLPFCVGFHPPQKNSD